MKVVYLSPSTQEKNIGVGSYGTEEYRMNLVADVVEAELSRHGVKVYRNKPEMTLAQVVEDSNKKQPDLHMAIHSDAYNGKARGCTVYCHRFGGVGEKLARNVYSEIEPLTPTADRGVREGHSHYGPGKPLYELAKTTAPAALVEVAFHDNPLDAEWIMMNIEPIGIGIAKGILKTLGIKYIPLIEDECKLITDECVARGWMNSPDYWMKALKGDIPVNPDYLRLLLSRATEHIPLIEEESKLITDKCAAQGWMNSPDYWMKVLKGDVPANPGYLRLLLRRAAGLS
jgi:N-acetylmuramoyl-L-alanine amidase